jgi:predicted ABC-type ATPase
MDRVEFSRKAARLIKLFKTFEEQSEFRKACRKAEASNPDNPLDALDSKFQNYFVETKSFKSAAELLDFIGKYSPDQERDERGRFGSGGGGGSNGSNKPSKPAKEVPATSGRKGMGDLPLTDKRLADFAGGSAEQYIVDGKFTAERQALHDEIVDKILDGAKAPESGKPTALVLGGGSASGKSTALEGGVFDVPANSATIDADAIKGMLPEYQDMTASKDPNAAMYSHEESSYLAARATAAAYDRGVNLVLDGTGDTSVEKITGKIDEARANGYIVNGAYVTVPTETAVERSNARGERTGRVVPEAVIRDIHASVSEIFPKITGKFDSVKLVDTSDGNRVVGEGSGGKWSVTDQALWEQFLSKAGG